MAMPRLLLCSALIAAYAAQAAHAQSTAPTATGEDAAWGTVEEVIVTAQKREQRITDVPMAISAFSGEFLEQVGGRELTNVAAMTPGFVIQLQDKFAPGFSIRGITSNDFQPQSEQRVAVFQDGVAVTQTVAAYGELFDIDRIEVEKGPQSTLHGRSALNGGVSIFQKRPTDEFSVELKGGVGADEYRAVEAVMNVPLSDTTAIRLGALSRQRDGFVEDSDGSGTYNALDAQAYRFSLRWQPTEDFSFNLSTTYDIDDTAGGVPFKSRTFLPLDQQTGAVVGTFDPASPTHLNTFGDLPSAYFKREIVGVSGTAELRINEQLSVTSITGYRWFDACQSGDNDGTPTNIIAYEQCNYGDQYSEEVRLNFTGLGPLEGFVGASAFRADNGMDFDLGYDERAMALLLGGQLQRFAPRGLTNAEINSLLGPTAAALKPFHLDRQLTDAVISTYDLFADVTGRVTDDLSLFAGGRMTWDEKEVAVQGLTPNGVSRLTGSGLLLVPTPNGAVLTGENSSTTATGRAGARYSLTPDINFYVVYGIGKRPEVLQLSGNRPPQITPTETLRSGEAGVKVRLFEGRLVGDASIFHYDYENFQTIGLVDGVMSTVNAGEADADGFEAQFSWSALRGVTMFSGYGYNKARFRSQAYAGNRFRNSPDQKFSFGFNLEHTVAGGTLSLVPVYSWQSKMFFFDDNDRLDLQQRMPAAYSDRVVDEFQDGFGLLNARLTYTPFGERWSVALIGDNLADEQYLVDAGNTGDSFGIPTFIAGTRRTYRAEVSVNF
jgi:outer membrane receptor protein involved in Fe transport